MLALDYPSYLPFLQNAKSEEARKRYYMRKATVAEFPDAVTKRGARHLAELATMPAGVEATIRESKDRRLLFILNTLAEPADVPNIPKGTDLLGDAEVKAGRMSEAARALVDAAQRTHYYDKISAKALVSNEASLKVLTKLGFERVSRKPRKTTASDKQIVLLELQRPRWM